LAHGPVFKQQLEIDPFENIELYNLMSGRNSLCLLFINHLVLGNTQRLKCFSDQ
jgi:hypothetical protein